MREWSCLEQHNESGTIQDLVLYRIETAKSDLKSAEVLLNAGEYRGANNRAYYSIYHAISAIHALNGKAYKRHKDSLGNFNKEYISKIQDLRKLFTHKNNNVFTLNDKGCCIYCGAMINDCN